MKETKKNLERLRVLGADEKRNIEKQLQSQFGIKEIPGKLIMIGGERLFVFLGDLDLEVLKKLDALGLIDKAGVYFAKVLENEDEIRLTIEGCWLLKNQITKNIFEIPDEQMENWMKGQDLLIQTGKKGYIAIKYHSDILGCGKASQEKIGNFTPKSRRLKERTVF